MTIAPIRRFYLGAAALAAIAGLLLFPLATETDRFFSWTIEPPLTAAFLGGAYWAALVLLGWAGCQATWAFARTAMPAVATIAALLLVTTLLHLDKFDLDSLFGWFWLIVYCAVTPLLVWMIARQLRAVRSAPESAVANPPGPRRPRSGPLPLGVCTVLGLLCACFAIYGVFLFADPLGTAWVWPLTPLTGRAIASFLLGFAVAAGFALWENDSSRLYGAALAFGTLAALELLALAIFNADVTASAAGVVAYVAFWLVSLVLGGAGVRLASSTAPRTAPGSR